MRHTAGSKNIGEIKVPTSAGQENGWSALLVFKIRQSPQRYRYTDQHKNLYLNLTRSMIMRGQILQATVYLFDHRH